MSVVAPKSELALSWLDCTGADFDPAWDRVYGQLAEVISESIGSPLRSLQGDL